MSNPTKINELGMDLDKWVHRSCMATVGVDEDEGYATIYSVTSQDQGKGHASELLTGMRAYYEGRGLRFGSSIALSPAMRHILRKLGIKEYTD